MREPDRTHNLNYLLLQCIPVWCKGRTAPALVLGVRGVVQPASLFVHLSLPLKLAHFDAISAFLRPFSCSSGCKSRALLFDPTQHSQRERARHLGATVRFDVRRHSRTPVAFTSQDKYDVGRRCQPRREEVSSGALRKQEEEPGRVGR